MPLSPVVSPARAEARFHGGVLYVECAGQWSITQARPAWQTLVTESSIREVRLQAGALQSWDSSLVLWVLEAKLWCDQGGVKLDASALPARVLTLLSQMVAAKVQEPARPRVPDVFTYVGLKMFDLWGKSRDIAHFVGECTLSAVSLVKQPAKFRWRDALIEMQLCGIFALPIVGLINFLVGVTLAYTGAIVLRQYGGDIYVADLVSLSMVREMGAMMTGIVMAGRTGAAFAAQIGNMRANEEVDALETLGVRPVDFLVMPRLFALAVMMPLLAIYGNALGIIGGMVVARGILEISPAAYWVEMLTIIDVSDIATGLIKATTFGVIVGLSGCLRGLRADRSASGVGKAATSAVVTAILLIILSDAVYAVIFDVLGW